jgi:ABC-2 type transport system permease protein
MKGLLAIEWLKIKSYRTFWILAGLFLFLLPAWNYGITNGFLKLGGDNMNFLNQAYSFSYVWENLGFWTSIFVAFLSVLVIILVSNEYQFRTNRQNVIDGWTRLDFYHAKWQMVILLSMLTTLYVFIVGFVFGISYGSMSDFPGNIENLFFCWVLALNYYGFSLLLAILFKRSGITIGLFFLYCMIIEALVSNLTNHFLHTKYGNFLPLQCSDELLPFPLLNIAKTMMGVTEGPSQWVYVGVSFAWIFIYYIAGRQRLLKSDW